MDLEYTSLNHLQPHSCLKRTFSQRTSNDNDTYSFKRTRLAKWLHELPSRRRSTRMPRPVFKVPPTPPSTLTRMSVEEAASFRDTASDTSSRSTRRLVEQPQYRRINLRGAGITYCETPIGPGDECLHEIVHRIRQPRLSPQPSAEDINMARLRGFEFNATEAQVQEYHRDTVFPERHGITQRVDQQTMPNLLPALCPPLSKPVPDSAYGLDLSQTRFSMENRIREAGGITNAKEDTAYTFLTIEFKGDSGALSTALNQCLGDAAACIMSIKRLEKTLVELPVQKICFSVAVSPMFASCFLMRFEDDKYVMKTVDRFSLGDYDQIIKYRSMMKNIIDWGAEHCAQIVEALERSSRSPAIVIENHMAGVKRPRGSSTRASKCSSRKKPKTIA
jgi:hypothetical protein